MKEMKRSEKNNNLNENTEKPIKIFISHSHEDKEEIKLLIELLQSCIDNIHDNEIRCTSVKGYKYKTGEDFYEMIKKETKSSSIIICAFSKDSLKSSSVLFESGIAWYLDKAFPIILNKEISFKDLPEPFRGKITKKIFIPDDINELLEDIKHKLQLKFYNLAKITEETNSYLAKYKEIIKKKSNNYIAGEVIRKGNAVCILDGNIIYNANYYYENKSTIVGFSNDDYKKGDFVEIINNTTVELENNLLTPGTTVFLNNELENNYNVSTNKPKSLEIIREDIDGLHRKYFVICELGVSISSDKFTSKIMNVDYLMEE